MKDSRKIQQQMKDETIMKKRPAILERILEKMGKMDKMEKICTCDEILEKASKSYRIKQYNILSLTPQKIDQIYGNIRSKFSSQNNNSSFEQWNDNQRRLFIWMLICYLSLESKTINQLGREDWLQFEQVFQGKSQIFFQFQAKLLQKMDRKTQKWTQQEDQHLRLIISKFPDYLDPSPTFRWSEIARKLFFESDRRFFKAPKQCRERWMTHLDPAKSKKKWTVCQDFNLIDSVIRMGKRWACIAKMMGNSRTEHTIKNRYNSILRVEEKKNGEIGDEGCVLHKLHNRLKYSVAKSQQKLSEEIQKAEQRKKSELVSNTQMEPQYKEIDEKKLKWEKKFNEEEDFLEPLDDILYELEKKNKSFTTTHDTLEIGQFISSIDFSYFNDCL